MWLRIEVDLYVYSMTVMGGQSLCKASCLKPNFNSLLN